MDALYQDIRLASRRIANSPAFAAAAALILALGIGANTAVFTLVDSVIVKDLPVAEPGELVYFGRPGFSHPIFDEVRSRATVFSGFFAWDVERLSVDWGREPEPASALLVTGEFHATLGVNASIGRTIAAADDRPGAPLVAVISHPCWRQRFGQDPSVVGRTLRIEGRPFTVIGVTPPGFFGVAVGMRPDVTIPVSALPLLKPQDAEVLRQPHRAWLHMMGRLRPGLTLPQANAALRVFWPQVLEATTPRTMPPDRRAKYLSRTTELTAGSAGFSRVRNQFSQPLRLLMGLVGLLLLVACATLGNLLLARASARRAEIALRLALGASRGRLVRQLLAEALVLAACGGAGGLVFGSWGSAALVRLLSTRRDPIFLDVAPDWRTLAFALSLTLATVVAFAVAPAFRSSGLDPGAGLRETGRLAGPDRSRSRLGRTLVVSQVSLSMLLVVGAALFARSLAHLLSLDPGFRPEDVLIVGTDPQVAGHRGPRLAAFYEQLLERLGNVPGVRSASLSRYPPISNEMGSWTQSVAIDGESPREEEARTYFNAVSAGYFDTLGTPLIRGRDFGLQDTATGPRTAVVNESLASALSPGQDPIGRRISIGRDASRQGLEIVGIVKDSKYQRLQEPDRRIAYLPYRQSAELLAGSDLAAELRTDLPASVVAPSVRQAIRELDSGVPVQIETLTERIRESLVNERVMAVLSGFLGAASLLLASAGLYGLMAYTATQRSREVGLRIALGAARSSVVWMVLKDSLTLAGLGVAAGLAGALALGRVVAGLIHGGAAGDPAVLAGSGLLMLAVATLAGYFPARRASRVDPILALRSE